MGCFSWKCCITGLPIINPGAGLDPIHSQAAFILPNDEVIKGEYDGYGSINGVDIYEKLAPIVCERPDATREDVFSSKKWVTTPDGKETFVLNKFRWDEPVRLLGGLSMNEAKAAGYKFDTIFDKTQELIKVVRLDAYSGQKFADLPPSESDPDQGIFISEETIMALEVYMSTKG